MWFCLREMKAAFDNAAVGQIKFDGICRVAACRTQRQQGLQGLFDIVRHTVQIHVVTQNFIEMATENRISQSGIPAR